MKMIVLLLTALMLSIVFTIAISVALFVEDKSSYILDYNLSHVRSSAQAAENQIQKALLFLRSVHYQVRTRDIRNVEKLFEDQAQSLKLRRLLVLVVDKEGMLKAFAALGDEDHTLVHHLDQLGWDSQRFHNDQVLVAKSSTGDLALGTMVRNPEGGGTAFLGLLTPDLGNIESLGDFNVFLVDSLGDPLFSKQGKAKLIKRTHLVEILKPLHDEKVTSGVRRWFFDSEEYMVAYNRLTYRELTVIGMTSDKSAFSAVQGLLMRSVVLGVSVLLISIGFALIFMKQITEGLRAMIAITEKVREGNFSFRIETRGMQNDEIGILATSFNLMAATIDDLVSDAATKVEERYEKEVNTLVQRKYLPQLPLNTAKFSLLGKSLFSEQCGGDWWHYHVFKDHVLTVVGKAEGKGLSAAGLIGITKGVVTGVCSGSQTASMGVPNLKNIVALMNANIHSITQGKQHLSCFISLIDTKTGQMEVYNAGHSVPYYYRKDPEKKSEKVSESFHPIHVKRHSALGASAQLRVSIDSIRLKPGDMVFWYTSGLLRTLNPLGETLDSEKVFGILSDLYERSGGQAMQISEEFLLRMKAFFAEISLAPPEDITIVVGTIPKKVTFEEEEEAA